MSTLIIAIIIIASIAGIFLLLVNIHNKEKRIAMNNLFKYFSQVGTENNLTFSSNEILKNSILGMDGLKRRILIVTKEDGYYGSSIIDLNKTRNCSVKKIYGTINSGELKSNKLEQFLERIVLHFELFNQPPVEIVFYNHFDNHIYEAHDLEQKARHWEMILSKMLMPIKANA